MDVHAVTDAVHRVGGNDPVGRVIAELQSRRGEVASALGGESLQVELLVTGKPETRHEYRLVFAPDGAAVRLRTDGALAACFQPHVTIRGTGSDIVEYVLGDLDVARAVYRGLVVLHVPPHDLTPRYPRLIRVVALALLHVAANDTPDAAGHDRSGGPR